MRKSRPSLLLPLIPAFIVAVIVKYSLPHIVDVSRRSTDIIAFLAFTGTYLYAFSLIREYDIAGKKAMFQKLKLETLSVIFVAGLLALSIIATNGVCLLFGWSGAVKILVWIGVVVFGSLASIFFIPTGGKKKDSGK